MEEIVRWGNRGLDAAVIPPHYYAYRMKSAVRTVPLFAKETPRSVFRGSSWYDWVRVIIQPGTFDCDYSMN